MKKVQLRAPAGNLTAVEEALNNGADAVYVGFASPTNLRNFSGLNLNYEDAKQSVKLAHERGKELYVVINSYPQKDEIDPAFQSIDQAVELGVDAVIVSDMANMEYIKENHPDLSIHCSVQTGSSNAEIINFWQDNFNVDCVVLPRVLNVDEIEHIVKNTSVEIEVFALGSLCTSYPGRCNISQYITGESTNTKGVCTSPKFLNFKENGNDDVTLYLNDIALNKIEDCGKGKSVHECKGHKGCEIVQGRKDGWDNSFIVNKRHVCKGQFINKSVGSTGYAMHDHVILNTLGILDRLVKMGVGAFKIEGRQRPSVYSGQATKVMREAIDLYYSDPARYEVNSRWGTQIEGMFQEMSPSVGPYLGR
jgi:putative protease